MAQIKRAYIVYVDFDGDIKSKHSGKWLVFTQLDDVKPVIREALTDLMQHEKERGRAATIDIGEYLNVPIANVLRFDNLLEDYIDFGGNTMGNWEITIIKTFADEPERG